MSGGDRVPAGPGAVYVVGFPTTAGRVVKSRPAVCLLSMGWGDPDAVVVMCAVTSSARRSGEPASVTLRDWREAGLDEESHVQVDRLFSTQPRFFGKLLGVLSQRDLDAVRGALDELIAGGSARQNA